MVEDSRTPQRFFLAALVLLTMLHWAILIFRLPVFAFFPGWFWAFMDKPWGNLPAFLLILVPAMVILILIWMKVKTGVGALVLMVLAGYCIQQGFALLEGRGIDGMRDRIVTTGHAEFAVAAVRQKSILSTMSHYEELLRDNKLGIYAASKPPGQLLLYMITERVGNMIHPGKSEPERLDRITTFASFVWPLISYLVVFPLFALGRILTDKDISLKACALFVFVPSVTLVTLHTDEVFFPLFSVSLVLFGVQAVRARGLGRGFLLGAAFYLSFFFSFGLLALAPFIALIGVMYGWQKNELRRIAWLSLFSLFGAAAADLLFRLTINYDIVVRYTGAVAYFIAWKNFIPGSLFLSSLGNVSEFAAWLGVPVALFCLAGVLDSAIHFNIKSLTWIQTFSIAFGIGMLAVDLFGGTKAEVARLWIFAMPFACIIAASEMKQLFARESGERVFLLTAVLQIVTIYFIKVNQDFW